jgi:hypothetical protein
MIKPVWSKEETKQLIAGFNASTITPHEYALEFSIANKNGRTQNAVYNKLFELQARGIIKIETKEKSQAKILFLDIETLPLVCYSWGAYKQFISPDFVIKDWCIICWCANWLGSDAFMSNCLTPKEALARNDKRIMNGIYKLLDAADFVVGHNLRRFDIKKLNTRFLLNGLDQPPSPYKTIDTLVEVRRTFGFTSNKQGYIAKKLGNDEKEEMHFEDWAECDNGNQESLDKMQKYNIADVRTQRQDYLSIRSWIPNHPNVSLYQGIDDTSELCRACGGETVKDKFYPTNKRERWARRCVDCGAVSF